MTSFERTVIGKEFKEIQVPSESIYNLIPDSEQVHEVHPRYKSQFSRATKKFYESVKKSHQTMGLAKIPPKSPQEYLKKHAQESNKSIVLERKPFTCLNEANKKPPIPKRDEVPPIFHEDPAKDFIKMNVLNALKTHALKPVPKTVHTRKGDSFVLEFSGLIPKFCVKEDFGKTPKYLVKKKKDLENSHEMFMKATAEVKHYMLSEDEKAKLIEGLRANWEQLNSRYLSLPLVIDTKVLQNRKLELEKKLNILEHDIDFLENNKDVDIYVVPENMV